MISRWSRRLIWVTLAITVTFFAVRVYYRVTDDFRISHMIYEMPHRAEWETKPLDFNQKHLLTHILKQPFYYVGKGAQSYVFISRDKNYVIKFFKFKHLKPNKTVEMLPDWTFLEEYKEKRVARKKRLIDSVFSGYKLAFDVHKEESGILYLHLNRTENQMQTVTLYDKIGRKYDLDLDPIVFVLQETAKTTRTIMNDALSKGDVELAKKRISQIFDLYLSEYEKGIYDRDHGVLHNTGFVGEKPIHLDVGKLTDEPKMKQEKHWRPDLEKIGHKYEVWLQDNYPEYKDELVGFIKKNYLPS